MKESPLRSDHELRRVRKYDLAGSICIPAAR